MGKIYHLSTQLLLIPSQTVQPEVIRVFDSGILAHVTPSKPVHYDHGLYVSIYDISGTQPRQKLKQAEITIGHIKVLKMRVLNEKMPVNHADFVIQTRIDGRRYMGSCPHFFACP